MDSLDIVADELQMLNAAVSSCPFRHAQLKLVSPSLSCFSISAPRDKSNSTSPRCPSKEAIISAVLPEESACFETNVSSFNIASAMLQCPCLVAR